MHELIIGLEIHVQLKTLSKMFCGCSTNFSNSNTNTCPTCLGLPGSLPSLNKKAIELTAKAGLVLNCQINTKTNWDRKQYFYPDLPKGYQTSQFDKPICFDGFFNIPNTKKQIRISHIHLEEDAGKIIHNGQSEIDLNRAGVPLAEIVTQPDFRSAEDVKSWLEELRLNLIYAGVSDCNMHNGGFRCDVNVNLKIDNLKTSIVEIKNLNSFKFIEKAIQFEEQRQLKEIKIGDEKETRGFNSSTGETYSQRIKEGISDYRYFPDPDLCSITIKNIPETKKLVNAREEWGLSYSDASVIVDRGLSEIYEEAIKHYNSKEVANWYINEPLSVNVPIHMFGDLIKFPKLVVKQILEDWSKKDFSVDSYPEIISFYSQSNDLQSIVCTIIEENPKAKLDFQAGKTASISFLIGSVLKKSKGENPKKVKELILEMLRK